MAYDMGKAMTEEWEVGDVHTLCSLSPEDLYRSVAVVKNGAALKELNFTGMRKSVQRNSKGKKVLARRIMAVTRNLDRLKKWATEIAPQNDESLLIVARSIWISHKTVQEELKLSKEVLMTEIQFAQMLKKGELT